MNEFDQFIKHGLHIKHYARYTDDFAIVASSHSELKNLIEPIEQFLESHLKLQLHPKKISVRTINHGIDFLGYVIFPGHRLIRTKTRRRIFKKFKLKVEAYRLGHISEDFLMASLRSYLGVLSHADTYHLAEELKNALL